MVFAGLLLVFDARSPTTAGSTVTAPAGAFAGPAAGWAHTRAMDRAADVAVDGAVLGFAAGVPDVLSQPVAVSRASASGAAANAQCRLLIPTCPPSRRT
ncbi:hypothetical protein GCM10011578_075340 [Streptomyces fuscichromogenes]|uniref:Uncharacterized protein n=1 Tax=Streptomyces fuscichromogenes TaxID=1324013 RepID=A0A917XK99_9ACTN|nr:hypothetical protein GCM10011578_075340 [Streptomyces fuscichromogenes]